LSRVLIWIVGICFGLGAWILAAVGPAVIINKPSAVVAWLPSLCLIAVSIGLGIIARKRGSHGVFAAYAVVPSILMALSVAAALVDK
jgi:hypothetical protein